MPIGFSSDDPGCFSRAEVRDRGSLVFLEPIGVASQDQSVPFGHLRRQFDHDVLDAIRRRRDSISLVIVEVHGPSISSPVESSCQVAGGGVSDGELMPHGLPAQIRTSATGHQVFGVLSATVASRITQLVG